MAEYSWYIFKNFDTIFVRLLNKSIEIRYIYFIMIVILLRKLSLLNSHYVYLNLFPRRKIGKSVVFKLYINNIGDKMVINVVVL